MEKWRWPLMKHLSPTSLLRTRTPQLFCTTLTRPNLNLQGSGLVLQIYFLQMQMITSMRNKLQHLPTCWRLMSQSQVWLMWKTQEVYLIFHTSRCIRRMRRNWQKNLMERLWVKFLKYSKLLRSKLESKVPTPPQVPSPSNQSQEPKTRKMERLRPQLK